MTDKPLPVDPLSDPYDWGHEGIPEGTPIFYLPGRGWIVEKDPPPPRPPTEENSGESGGVIALIAVALLANSILLFAIAVRNGWL